MDIHNTFQAVTDDKSMIDLDKTMLVNEEYLNTSKAADALPDIIEHLNGVVIDCNTEYQKLETSSKDTLDDIEGTLQAISDTEAYLKEFKGKYTIEEVIADIVAGIRLDIENNK